MSKIKEVLDLPTLYEQLPFRPREIKTFHAMPQKVSTKRKLAKFGRKGWQVTGQARRAVYSRDHTYTLSRPQVTKAEAKLLGW